MNVLLFGATGMIGQGVLLECLRDIGVQQITTIGRGTTGVRDARLREIVHKDLGDFSGMEAALADHDACFYCLGVSSSGMSEAEYTRITYGFTLAAAQMLSVASPGAAFIYV
ncbi:MAG: NAD-dependent epimerase/dehydratase family protein, partial [Terracidiphilus sp.]